jgi:large subunit ribosomal protein L17
MNSKTSIYKGGRRKANRELMNRNLLSDLIIYEYITTTKQKAKTVVSQFDRIVTYVKNTDDKLLLERRLGQTLVNGNAISKLMEVYKKRFAKEKSGFVQIFKIGSRPGDNAALVKLIVKGYIYRDIGKKVGKTVKKDETKKEITGQQPQFTGAQQNTLAKSQTAGKVTPTVTKSRTGV